MVNCSDCKGEGYTIFAGKEKDCIFCRGAGEVTPCNSFTREPNAVAVFRNQRCHNCGVKENDHVKVAV